MTSSAAIDILNTSETRPRVRFQGGHHKRVKSGHPWVFSNEIEMTPETKKLPPGGIVVFEDNFGGALGAGMFNPLPLICGRILSRDPDAVIDRAFIAGLLRSAADLRALLVDVPYYRLVHAESDGLPGLIVDRYGDVAVVQANTAGMNRLLPEITGALGDVLGTRSFIVKSDSPARGLEGLDFSVTVSGEPIGGPLRLSENGCDFLADPAGGQKTGWFYDHRENRAAVAHLAGGKRVLDVYSYLGGFGIQAAVAGAAEVVCIDRSQEALDLAAQSAALNDVAERCRFVRAEAYAELERLASSGERFDIVIADPPAFIKSRKDVAIGTKGYRKLFRLAAALVAKGGFLFAASCSYHLTLDSFGEQVRGGLRSAQRGGRILRSAGAGPDHPVHPYLPETAYLKSMLLQLD